MFDCCISIFGFILAMVGLILFFRNKNTYNISYNGPSHEDIPEELFSEIVKTAGKNVGQDRLTRIYNNGSNIYGTIKSQSGASEWDFSIDFRDDGYSYIHSDNEDSKIPQMIDDDIQEMVKAYYNIKDHNN